MKNSKGKDCSASWDCSLCSVSSDFSAIVLFRRVSRTDENECNFPEWRNQLGLDLAGGVSITYQAKEENQGAGYVRYEYRLTAEVRASGSGRRFIRKAETVSMLIFRVSRALNKILEELGKPGSLRFYDENWNVAGRNRCSFCESCDL